MKLLVGTETANIVNIKTMKNGIKVGTDKLGRVVYQKVGETNWAVCPFESILWDYKGDAPFPTRFI